MTVLDIVSFDQLAASVITLALLQELHGRLIRNRGL